MKSRVRSRQKVSILSEEHGDTFSRFALAGPGGQGTRLFVLPDLAQDISATKIRAALAEGENHRWCWRRRLRSISTPAACTRRAGIPWSWLNKSKEM